MDIFQMVDIERLRESPLNPRQHYDQKKIEELADSMKGSTGILEPLLVRPGIENNHFEIIAGNRRYRAAKIAGLTGAPVIVREVTDTQALEIMVIENNQREDVNALEEAEGYKRLMEHKYSLEVLAAKIGHSTKYIYDRLKLLQLVPEAQKLLLADKISPGHAIVLARLKPAEQKRTIDPDNFEIWKRQNLLFVPGDEPEEDSVKIVSVRELQAWIDEHVRFDKKVPVDAMLFPETAAAMKAAMEEKEKVIQITYNHYTQRDAKEGNTERIFHISSWKIADGTKGDKTCDKSVTGVIVVGPERGKAHKVCVNKDCNVHWAREKKARAKAAGSGDKYRREEDGHQAQWQREQQEREAKQAAWKQARPEILKACAEKLKQAKPGTLSEILQRAVRRWKDAQAALGKWKTAEDLLRLAAMAVVIAEYDEWMAWESGFASRAKRFGVDVAAILEAHAPKEKAKAVDQLERTLAGGVQ